MPGRASLSALRYNSSREKNPHGKHQTSLVIQVDHSWCDNGNVNYNSSNANFPNVGGSNSDSTGNAGIFYCNVNNNSTNSNSNNGSRNSIRTIAYHAPPTIVESLYDRASWQNTTCKLRTLVLPLGVGHRKMCTTDREKV